MQSSLSYTHTLTHADMSRRDSGSWVPLFPGTQAPLLPSCMPFSPSLLLPCCLRVVSKLLLSSAAILVRSILCWSACLCDIMAGQQQHLQHLSTRVSDLWKPLSLSLPLSSPTQAAARVDHLTSSRVTLCLRRRTAATDAWSRDARGKQICVQSHTKHLSSILSPSLLVTQFKGVI